ncbi:gamma-glutamyl-gamma-aminobutyrate hydrolase family protein [Anaerosphaera multitolerans]|uniref:Gamma-glutamyl-gamma-aminobutyrate hydrolase family protein n=1 Tax=Anaerosphaera multitolerans TaxID=2487351 RepID=A0A437S9C2_9FIRM|nr:gamma-glutamyl-gamma-aminobutyrate hydrolase family protein [Anaerosphaera multitolerans]RVU55709.1 gamma-glutamyl-gamma-aminobutyrate hydrolase family protein [Anaerosphaera multitolerans]
MRPLIAITPRVDSNWESVNMNSEFFNFLEDLGATPIILPYNYSRESIDNILNKVDGLLFTGGHDINPMYYGEFPTSKCHIISPKRDAFESELMRAAIEKDIPLLAICRGMQLLNIVQGGSLYQDIDSQYKTSLKHINEEPFDKLVHSVEIIKDNPFGSVFKKDLLEVNSLHHQAIKDLGSNLKVFSKSTDGLVEGIYMEDKKFICGVQWHPEFLYKTCEDNKNLLLKFIESCKI